MKEIIFIEETPESHFYVDDIEFLFDGDIRDFRKHFINCETIETEGAGIWIIVVK